MRSTRFLKPTTVALFVAAAPCATAQTVLYVDAGLTTGANDGSSWDNAYQGSGGLQVALNASAVNDDIYVAQGTYVPAAVGQRGISFLMRPSVGIFGGFVGGETSPQERPPLGAAPTILSGDLASDDAGGANMAENSYHVLRSAGTNQFSVLDGFVVTGGNANAGGANRDRGGGILAVSGENPLIRNCEFVGNRCTFGGGAGYLNGSSPRFEDVTFRDNSGGSFGGAFDIATGGSISFDRCTFDGNTAARAGALEIFSTSGTRVTNCVFYDNVSTSGSGGGGAIWLGSGGTTTITGCTIVRNTATNQAQGGIRIQGANAIIRNCIAWDNVGNGNQGANNQISPNQNVSYCLVEGTYATGTGNLDSDPMFVDAANDDFQLAMNSPAIDAGDNGSVAAGSNADRAQRRRQVDAPSVPDTGNGTAPLVDIGAYEWTTNIGTVVVDCMATANSTGTPGKIDVTGSPQVAANDVTLVARDLPQNAAGFFIVSRTTGIVVGPTSAILCLTGSIGRFVGPGQVQNSGATGAYELTIDLGMMPTPTGLVTVLPGDTWAFQSWHRDAVLGIPTSNFTDAVRVQFE